MQKSNSFKRLLAVILSAAMALGLFVLAPLTAQAAVVGGGDHNFQIGLYSTSNEYLTFDGYNRPFVTQDMPANTGISGVNNGLMGIKFTGTALPGTVGTYTVIVSDPYDNTAKTNTMTIAPGPQTIAADYGVLKNMSDIYVTPGSATFTLAPYSLDGNGNKIPAGQSYSPAYTFSVGSGTSASLGSGGVVTPNSTLGDTTILINSAATDSYTAAPQKTITVHVTDSLNNVPYLDADGTTQYANNVTALTQASFTSASYGLANGWYLVSGDIALNDTLTISGDVHLILGDGYTLTVNGSNAGIDVEGANSLTIYAQSTNPSMMGSLKATGGGIHVDQYDTCYGAGIGAGYNTNAGAITINGGNITASGGGGNTIMTDMGGAGIGGGGAYNGAGSGGNITINGGVINATGGRLGGAGIGGGYCGSAGNITINGGTITAIGGQSGAGIGGGENGAGGNITINGGNVTANGGALSGAGIGGGGAGWTSGDGSKTSGASGNITITGSANVTAIGANGGPDGLQSGAPVYVGGGAGIGSGGSYGSNIGGIGTITSTVSVNATGGTPGTGAGQSGANIGSGGGGTSGTATSVTPVTNPATYTVTATASPAEGGAATAFPGGATGPVQVPESANQTFLIRPNPGYILAGLTVGGVPVAGTPTSYTITNVTADTTITATFILDPSVTVPDAPANVMAAAGSASGSATVSFSAPANTGGVPVTEYTVTSNPGNITATGVASPITVTGLPPGTAYTFTVTAANAAGPGAASAASNAVTLPTSPTLSLTAVPSGSLILPGDVTLTAQLSGAVPLAGQTLTFTKNGADLGTGITNSSGAATYIITSPVSGTYTFGAYFAGDDSNNPVAATPITGYPVGLGAQQALTLRGLNNAYTYGDAPFGLSVSGGSGAGAVTYTATGSAVSIQNGVDQSGNSAVDQARVTINQAGAFTITAAKAADANYSQASVTSGEITVSPATPGLNATTAATGLAYGNDITVNAAVYAVGDGITPTGTVTLSEGGTLLDSQTLNSSGTAILTAARPSAGLHDYTIAYSGQSGYYNPASVVIQSGVGLADQAPLSITGLPASVTYGAGGFTLSTGGGSGTGSVSFSAPNNNGVVNITTGGAVTIIGAGTTTITATKGADSNYNSASAQLVITVLPRDIGNATVTVAGGPFTYTGSQLQPNFSVSDGSIAITTGDYTNAYGANVNAGTGAGSITITGQGNYTGAKTITFDINPLDLSAGTVTLAGAVYPYTGSPIEPAVVSVLVNGITVPAEDYDVSYADNINPGTATVTVTANTAGANFTGSAEASFVINEAAAPVPAPPVLTAGPVNRTSDAVAAVQFTSDTAGTYYYAVAASGAAQPAIDTSGAGAPCGTAANTISLTNLTAGAQVIYIVVRDSQDQLSNVLAINIPAYSRPNNNTGGGGSSASPSNSLSTNSVSFTKDSGADVTVTLNSGGYTLTGLTNNGSTLQKGTDYTVSGNTVTISAAYLNTLSAGVQNITMAMSGGTNPVLKITIAANPNPAPANPTTPAVPQPGSQTGQTANPFVDVHRVDWFYNDVMYVYGNSLMTGTSTSPMRFSPQTNLTRAMLVTILYRAAGSPDTSTLANRFSDVAAGQWYTQAVKWAAANSIVTGYTSSRFGPNDSITREQLVAMIYRYAQSTGQGTHGAGTAQPSFSDSKAIADWAVAGTTFCYQNHVIGGYPDGSFKPQGTASRAEVAAMLHRYLTRLQ